MQGLKLAIRVLCILAFVTGVVDMFAGVHLLIIGGGRLESVANDPVLNSQVGFWGAIWFGFGIILWRTNTNLQAEASLFRILCGITALSGIARLGSAFVYGLPGPVLTIAMIVEICAGVGLFLWHAAALKGDRSDTPVFASSCGFPDVPLTRHMGRSLLGRGGRFSLLVHSVEIAQKGPCKRTVENSGANVW